MHLFRQLLVGLAAILLQGREELKVEAVEGNGSMSWRVIGGNFTHKEGQGSNSAASHHGMFAEAAGNAHTYLQL